MGTLPTLTTPVIGRLIETFLCEKEKSIVKTTREIKLNPEGFILLKSRKQQIF